MSEELKKLERNYNKAKYELCETLLLQCTQEQQTKFHRVFSAGVLGIPLERIDMAITLCERTIKSNLKLKLNLKTPPEKEE